MLGMACEMRSGNWLTALILAGLVLGAGTGELVYRRVDELKSTPRNIARLKQLEEK